MFIAASEAHGTGGQLVGVASQVLIGAFQAETAPEPQPHRCRPVEAEPFRSIAPPGRPWQQANRAVAPSRRRPCQAGQGFAAAPQGVVQNTVGIHQGGSQEPPAGLDRREALLLGAGGHLVAPVQERTGWIDQGVCGLDGLPGAWQYRNLTQPEGLHQDLERTRGGAIQDPTQVGGEVHGSHHRALPGTVGVINHRDAPVALFDRPDIGRGEP